MEAAVGYQEGLRLMASDSIWDKQVGYLYISLVFDNQPEMQRLVVQCLLDDLRQEAYSHPYVHQLALTLVAHFRNAEIAHHIAPTLEKFLCSLDSITGTQQSVCLCQEVLASIDPEGGVSNGKWFQVIFTWLDSGSCDTVKNILSLIKTLLTVRYNEFAVCIPQLLVFFQESVRRLPQYSSGTSGDPTEEPQRDTAHRFLCINSGLWRLVRCIEMMVSFRSVNKLRLSFCSQDCHFILVELMSALVQNRVVTRTNTLRQKKA